MKIVKADSVAGPIELRPLAKSHECACSKCTEQVREDEYTFPDCKMCYANIDGKCD